MYDLDPGLQTMGWLETVMFCPKCGELNLDIGAIIRCPSHVCAYVGPAENVVTLITGKRIETSQIRYTLHSPIIGYDRDGRKIGVSDNEKVEHHNSINEAQYNEYREMREGWSYGPTQHDVYQYG